MRCLLPLGPDLDVHKRVHERLQGRAGRCDGGVVFRDSPRLGYVGRVLDTSDEAAVGPVTFEPRGQMPHRGTALVG
jgi:hypothetical protein